MKNNAGQIVIVLLLTMLVALAVGLTITQRSITDLSTSTQTEQSSRALSAAEAGLEKALSLGDISSSIPVFDLGNQATGQVAVANKLPRVKTGTTAPQALEWPPIGKEQIAQFWLADPVTLNSAYTQSRIDVYFGEWPPSAIKPAFEVSLVTRNASGDYLLNKYFYETDNARLANGFTACPDISSQTSAINTTSSRDATTADRYFNCHANLTIAGGVTPIIVRIRMLYSNIPQRVAVKPYDPGATCVSPYTTCSLPAQATIYSSTGTAGQSQKVLQVFRAKIVPFYFDYALFSAGDINK